MTSADEAQNGDEHRRCRSKMKKDMISRVVASCMILFIIVAISARAEDDGNGKQNYGKLMLILKAVTRHEAKAAIWVLAQIPNTRLHTYKVKYKHTHRRGFKSDMGVQSTTSDERSYTKVENKSKLLMRPSSPSTIVYGVIRLVRPQAVCNSQPQI